MRSSDAGDFSKDLEGGSTVLHFVIYGVPIPRRFQRKHMGIETMHFGWKIR